ncbi:glycoside hydrolase superfamily [Dactylonectria macrodidyma]|uniref:Probable beta-glucosidase btgE n=1 Tax=Dactylonectria macrodidyma TaxID=307937 RepID=A0A9P9E7Z5_9HYPO|nr:glycoside hydrolase superfamily [Dactylonectria macrodidyma]
MKGAIAAAAVAAMATGAQAAYPHHRRAHDLFKRGEEYCIPGCTTIWTTVYGEPTLVPNPPPVVPTTSSAVVTSSAAPVPETTSTSKVEVYSTPEAPTSTKVVVVVPVPTPEVHDCPTPGTYTFPATTVTVTESTTVCGAETTKVPAGTHTVGGVTTIVETATTVTCPYAKETEINGVVTSVIDTTVYVCPSAGTYTIAPITKSCDVETILVYPVPTSYAPGTYTAPEQVVTVTETGYVYVCPYSSEGLVATSSAPAVVATSSAPAVYEAPAPTTTAVIAYEVPSSVVYEAPKSSSTKTKSSSSSKSTGKTYTPGNLQGSNDHYGITYTPYESSNGDCKSASQVKSDIQVLKQKGFSIVRSYSTDCDTLSSVGPACEEYGMDMIIGVFVKGTGCSYDSPDIKTQVDAIAEWAQWDLVKLFVVGNEAIMNGYCTAAELAELVTVVKSKCSGYTGPYTIAETLNIWQQDGVAEAICPVIDVTGANIHPYFNSETAPSAAGKFVKGQLDILADICSGNDVINLECGWPTSGECNGLACPGEEQQAAAISSIRESCGDKTVFFSYENDLWKEAGSCGCEQSWGCKNNF